MAERCVLHYVAAMDRAGEETFIMNVFRNIDKDKVMFGFLCSSNKIGDYDREIENLGGKIMHINLVRKYGPLKRLVNFFVLLKKLKSLRGDYDVFHIHAQHAMDSFIDSVAAKIAGFGLVIVHSHSNSTLFHVKAHYLFRPLLRSLNICRLACSDDAGVWLFGKRNKYKVICNGIDLNYFTYNEKKRSEMRTELNLDKNTFLIGHVGSFTYPKNHEFLVDIFEEFHRMIPNSKLILVGKGPEYDNVFNKVTNKRLQNEVLFLGTREDTADLYSAMDAFIFPSRYEGLGIVVVEAQATGLPCVISDILPDDLDMTKLVIRCSLEKGAEVWANVLESIYTSSSDRHIEVGTEIGNAGYDIQMVASQLENIYLGR